MSKSEVDGKLMGQGDDRSGDRPPGGGFVWKRLATGDDTSLEVGDRTVAFIDMLGFKERVRTSDLHKLARTLQGALVKSVSLAVVHAETLEKDAVVEVDWTKRKCGYFAFSDAILLYSFDSSFNSCVNIILSAWYLVRSLFAFTFPCRGAICFGPLAVDARHGLFVGQSVIDAYMLSEAQDWCGAMISPSVHQAHPELYSAATRPGTLLESLLYPYRVPFKPAAEQLVKTDQDYLCLNWRLNLVVHKGTSFLFGKPRTEDARRKVSNTLEFCRVIRQKGRLYAHGVDLPPLLTPMAIGDREPHFPHGDEY